MCEAESIIAPEVARAVQDYLMRAGASEAVRQAHLCGTGSVAALEAKLRQHYGKRYALCVTNATSGLLALALALDLQDRAFITTPLTYGASLSGWLLRGNRPLFVDIDPHTLTLDPAAIGQAITPDVRALLAVDLFGVPSDDAALRRLADEHGLWYVADAAQSLGAEREGRPSSAQAHALVVSFTVGKTLFAGEGAAILTDHEDLYEKLVWYTQHPYRQKRDLGLSLSNEFALNMRIHPLAAVWAEATFEPALKRLHQHQAICFDLIDRLNDTGLIEPIDFLQQGIRPSFFRLTAAWQNCPHPEALAQALRDTGYAVCISGLPVDLLYQQPAFQAQYEALLVQPPHCPVAERQVQQRVCLWPSLDDLHAAGTHKSSLLLSS